MRIEDQPGSWPVIELSSSLQFLKAESAEWERYWAVFYHQATVGFRIQSGLSLLDSEGFRPYWLKRDDAVVGGAALAGHAIRSLFTIPPFQADSASLKLIARKMKEIAGKNRTFHACDILPDQEDLFIRAGFRPESHRHRWMQRPAAEFVHPSDHRITLLTPGTLKEENGTRFRLEREIGLFLFKHAYEVPGNGAEASPFAEVLTRVRHYFARNVENVLQASSLLYDKQSHALIAVCLIGLEAGGPVIHELVVMPAFRGRGLATRMLQHALTVLAKQGQELLRIRVMHGHPLESLCFQLGFMPGPLFIPSMTLY